MTLTSAILLPWDHGIHWQTQPMDEYTTLPVPVEYVMDQVLRVANDGMDNEHVTELIYAALQAAEEMTDRAIALRTWTQVMSGFPSREIVIQRPPLVDVTSIEYYDDSHELQTWGSSPYPYVISPSGKDTKARIVPGDGESWPTTATRPDAVTVTFEAGYTAATVPPLIKQGICLHVAEQYKQRSLGVINVQYSPAALQLAHFWKKVYG